MDQSGGLSDLIALADQDNIQGAYAREVLAERPSLSHYETIVWDALGVLMSERPIGMAMGPIPFSAIRRYGEWLDIRRPYLDRFIIEVMHLDAIIVGRKNEEAAAKSK